jgi:hypothetical protein
MEWAYNCLHAYLCLMWRRASCESKQITNEYGTQHLSLVCAVVHEPTVLNFHAALHACSGDQCTCL